jgi:hypothetical protein
LKAIKLFFCVLAGIFTLSSLLQLMVTIPVTLRMINSSATDQSSYAFGMLAGGIFAVIIGAAVTRKLWQSAMKPKVGMSEASVTNEPPIPEPRGRNHE